jgi:hypothetical protein
MPATEPSVLDLLDAAATATGNTARDRPEAEAYDILIPSDGLTVDTPLGPVDLVAVHRVVTGRPHPLTPAEHAWIRERQPHGARRAAARTLGTGYPALLRALAAHRHRTA